MSWNKIEVLEVKHLGLQSPAVRDKVRPPIDLPGDCALHHHDGLL